MSAPLDRGDLLARVPMREGEAEADWVRRAEREGGAVVLGRDEAKDARRFRAAQARAAREDRVLVLYAPPPAHSDDELVVARDELRDPADYRRWRAAAARAGKRLVAGD